MWTSVSVNKYIQAEIFRAIVVFPLATTFFIHLFFTVLYRLIFLFHGLVYFLFLSSLYPWVYYLPIDRFVFIRHTVSFVSILSPIYILMCHSNFFVWNSGQGCHPTIYFQKGHFPGVYFTSILFVQNPVSCSISHDDAYHSIADHVCSIDLATEHMSVFNYWCLEIYI